MGKGDNIMTTLFRTTCGKLEDWDTTNDCEVVTSPVIEGIEAIKSTGASSAMLYEWYDETCSLTNLDEVWTRFYFYLKNSNPTGLVGNEIFFFVDANCCCGDAVSVKFKRSGNNIILRLESFEMGQTDDGTTALQSNTWYCLELYVQHGTAATITLRLNGVDECEVAGDNQPSSNYNRMDRICIESLGHGYYYDYIVIDYVKITNDGWMGATFDAERRVTISNTTGTILCGPLRWSERQNCNVALRNVPLRKDGQIIDTDTYVLKNRVLNTTLRLTDTNKDALEAIFNASKIITIRALATTAGFEWIYTGWLRVNPRIYEYSKNDEGERIWIAELEFAILTFVYQVMVG